VGKEYIQHNNQLIYYIKERKVVGPAGRYALDGQIWRWIYHVVRAILSGDTKAWYYNDIVG